MKNSEIVKKLIAELKSQATTNFELHRVEVLEKDFFDPPKIEIIDDEYQKFNGVVYHRLKSGHFFRYHAMYRAVWEYYNGTIPEGDVVIHHIDFDKTNNNPENLQLLTRSEHQHIHEQESSPISYICQYCGKQFKTHRGAAKFCSAKCQENASRKKRKCAICGKEFLALKETKCCSRECGNKLALKTKREKNNLRKCKNCGKEFLSLQRDGYFCSRKCYADYERKNNLETRICPICGKEFPTYIHGPVKFCSHSCAAKSQYDKYWKNN